MSVKIGHASADERNKASGGLGGDQTGGEVCVRDWYSSPWDALLRPKDRALAEASALSCEKACANECIGYDQLGRNSLYYEAKKLDFDLAAIETACECDCSSLMHVCALAGGAKLVFEGNCFWTGNMVEGFLRSGEYECLRDDKFLRSDAYLKRGDILVKTSGHTAMVLENGSLAEDGGEASDYAAHEAITMKTPLPLLTKGAWGRAVWAMQLLLTARGYNTLGVDSKFGDNTLAALLSFQKAMGLEVDGECGEKSWAALIAKG